MRVHLGDEPEVGLDDPAELLLHLLQPGAERPLEVGQGDGRGLGAHFAPSRGESVHAVAQVHEADVHRQGALVAARSRPASFPWASRGAAQPVEQADLRVVAARPRVSTARRSTVSAMAILALVEERRCPAPPRCGAGPRATRSAFWNSRDRLVEQPHLLEGDAEVVVGLVVVGVEVLLDALLELLQDLLELPLLVLALGLRAGRPASGCRAAPLSSRISEPRSTNDSGRAGGGGLRRLRRRGGGAGGRTRRRRRSGGRDRPAAVARRLAAPAAARRGRRARARSPGRAPAPGRTPRAALSVAPVRASASPRER